MSVVSNLAIDLINSSDYASRGISQSLALIKQASQLKRTVNGTLVDIGLAQFRKYRSTISGRDQLPPAFDGIHPGLQVVVSCAAELSYLTSGGSPSRTVVSGSSRTEGAWTFYRPQLTMRVISFDQQSDEWGAGVNWSIELEEV